MGVVSMVAHNMLALTPIQLTTNDGIVVLETVFKNDLPILSHGGALLKTHLNFHGGDLFEVRDGELTRAGLIIIVSLALRGLLLLFRLLPFILL